MLVGKTDSGKSFLADYLTSLFPKHSVGMFTCPTGNNPSNFFLANLATAVCARCDEWVFENALVTQVMKQVFEGSESLQTDIKYKDSITIDPKPVILTLNADSFDDAFKWLPNEKANFETRCTALVMNTPMVDRVPEGTIGLLKQCKEELLWLMYRYKKVKTTVNVDLWNNFNKL